MLETPPGVHLTEHSKAWGFFFKVHESVKGKREGSWRLSLWRSEWSRRTSDSANTTSRPHCTLTIKWSHCYKTYDGTPYSSGLYVDRFFPSGIYPRVCLPRRASEGLLKISRSWSRVYIYIFILAYGFDSVRLIRKSPRAGLSFWRTLDETFDFAFPQCME